MRRRLVSLTAGLAFAAATPATAQPATPAQRETDQPASLVDRLKEPDQGGGFHLTEHWAVVFGGIKSGSGIALGPAFSTRFADGGFFQIKGVYSVRNFKLLQLRYDSRPFWSERGIVINRLRWQDAPELKLYPLGIDSPNRRVDYHERMVEGSSEVFIKLAPRINVGGGFGIERYSTRNGRLDELSDPETLILVALPPGLGARPWFAHTFGTIAYDTREYPEYSRSGQLFEAQLHDYHDLKDGQNAFQRFEGTAQQMIPVFDRRGVIDVSGRVWLSASDDPRAVPFYLMPTLGGRRLRAFPSYRFRDRHAILLKAEYRWAVHEFADVAGIYEAGKVAPQVKKLGFDGVAHSIGVGIRAHTDKATVFRADVAYGREGWGFRIGFSGGGS